MYFGRIAGTFLLLYYKLIRKQRPFYKLIEKAVFCTRLSTVIWVFVEKYRGVFVQKLKLF
ncbi:hypothetical protein CLOSTMETH_00435 [[Clostridium] methylpentosum DSM 5476]|uniref:Uncharacterized protein n=1 Tax=[Clostridium] methylpentosum DSM 5476 TaxID=537013 RepID=C0E9D7_9FIRM|nr:hypothetical protein CLOSTMETH_00435 [[Clostridium] methylpentosum DSM 5476]